MQFEGLKDFDVAALRVDGPSVLGRERELPVELIHPDPDNIRKDCSEEAIRELAHTIQAEGLLQAITVRTHPTELGSFLISYGERRWRAARLLGLTRIRAVIDENFDPYKQAIENLQREDLTPMQVARFIAKREAQGDSRSAIAKRLGKSKSFISELAYLVKAPPVVRDAFEAARIDTRTAYLLARHYEDRPEQIQTWLAGDAPLSRSLVTQELGAPRRKSSKTLSLRKKGYNVRIPLNVNAVSTRS